MKAGGKGLRCPSSDFRGRDDQTASLTLLVPADVYLRIEVVVLVAVRSNNLGTRSMLIRHRVGAVGVLKKQQDYNHATIS